MYRGSIISLKYSPFVYRSLQGHIYSGKVKFYLTSPYCSLVQPWSCGDGHWDYKRTLRVIRHGGVNDVVLELSFVVSTIREVCMRRSIDETKVDAPAGYTDFFIPTRCWCRDKQWIVECLGGWIQST